MSEVGALNIDLALNWAKFRDGLNSAKASLSDFEKSGKAMAKEFNKFGKDLDKLGTKLTTNLTAPILAAGAAIGVALHETAKYGDEINNMSIRTGISRGQLQELKFAAGQVGVQFDSLVVASKGITKALGETAQGNKKTATLFKQLGVSTTDANGNLRKSSEVMNDVIAALHNVDNETTRNVIGQQLFGRSYSELIPLVDAGGQGLEKYAQQARDAGLVLSDEAIVSADEFGDTMDKMKAQVGHAGMELASAFMPIVQKLATVITDHVVPAVKAVAEWFKNLSPTMQNVVLGVAGLAAAAGPAISIFGKLSSMVGSLIPMLMGLSLPVVAIAAAVAAMAAVIFFNWDSIVAYFTTGPGSTTWNNLKEATNTFVETISDLFETLVGFVVNLWERFGDDIVSIFSDALSFGMDIAGTMLNQIGDIFAIFGSLLSGDWQGLWDGIVSLVVNSFQLIFKAATAGMNLTLAVIQKGASVFSDDLASGVQEARDKVNAFKDGIISYTNQFKRVAPETDHATTAMAGFKSMLETTKPKVETLTVSLGAQAEKLQAVADGFDKYQADIKASKEANTAALAPIQAWADANKNAAVDMEIMGGITTTVTTAVKNCSSEFVSSIPAMEAWMEVAKQVGAIGTQMAVDVFNGIGEAIGGIITGSQTAGEAMRALFIGVFNNLKKIGAALIATGVPMLLAVATAPEGAKMIAAGTGIVAAATVGVGVASAFEHGGLVFGETMGIVGEGRGTSKSNPEVIAPLDKLRDFMPQGDGGFNGQVEFLITGETLRAVLSKNNSSRRFLGNKNG